MAEPAPTGVCFGHAGGGDANGDPAAGTGGRHGEGTSP
jgi:hypothetical protein